jgi:hypothetical protein
MVTWYCPNLKLATSATTQIPFKCDTLNMVCRYKTKLSDSTSKVSSTTWRKLKRRRQHTVRLWAYGDTRILAH